MDEVEARFLSVPRKARWFEQGAPGNGPAAERWIVLHGYGQLARRFLRQFESVVERGRHVVAPEGLSRFYLDSGYERIGASWMTREDRDNEIGDTLEWLDRLVEHLDERDGRPGRTVVFGFSQGSHTAGRWLARGRVRAHRLVCWGSALPHDVDLAAHRDLYAGLDLTLVVGSRDEYVTPQRLEVERDRLASAGIPYRLVEYDGPHRIDRGVLAELVEELP